MAHQGPDDSMATTSEIAPASLSGANNGAGVDMNGWNGVRFIVHVGAMTATATLDAKVQTHEDASFGTGTVDVSGAALTQILAATGGGKVYAIDVWRPGEQFVRIVVTQATAAVLASATATRYRRTGRIPATQTLTELVKVLAN